MTHPNLHDLNSQALGAGPMGDIADKGVIGFIGIGNMGFAMMARLLSQDWHCASYDIEPAQNQKALQLGAQVLPSPADIGKLCRVTFIVVVNAAQVETVLWGPKGLLSTSKPGDVIYLCPTLGPLDVSSTAHRAKRLGVDIMDAPMSGGPVRAREGQMSLMLAGPAPVLQSHTRLLDAITPHRFTISETAGDAAKTKLANNLLAAIHLAGISEVLAMAQAWGLNAQTTLNVMQASSGQSWIGQDRMQRALQNDFAPRAHTSLLAKDTQLAMTACESLGSAKPQLGLLATHLFAEACANGYMDHDDASLFLKAGGQAEV